MKFKHIILISLLVAILAISAVSGANHDASLNDTVIEDEHVLSVSEESDGPLGLEDNIEELTNGSQTFSDISGLIESAGEGDSINLSGYYSGSGSQIDINKEITITGIGETVLDAQELSSILSISADNVKISNIKFINAKNDGGWGGAIYCDGPSNVIITNCTFINNKASWGAGIFWWGNDGYMANCTFENNTAERYGGALYVNGDHLRMIDSEFKNNVVTNSITQWEGGGSIYTDGNNHIVANSTFIGNSATNSWGGAIKHGSETATYQNNVFYSNSALRGTSVWESDANNLVGNIFNLNSIDEIASCVEDANLSAVFDLNTFKVNNTIISKEDYFNSLSNSSGTGNNTFKDLANLINETVEGNVLELNEDYINDGEISSEGIDIEKALTIDGKGHTLDAKGKSRVFNIKCENVTLKNIIFRNAFIGGESYGGAITNGGYNGNIFNCTFINCSSGQSAGAVGGYGDESIFSYCSFINCSSADHSGAVDWAYDCNIFNSTFVNCSGRYGGAMACGWLGDECVIYNCTYVNCSSSSAVDSGGAIWFVGSYLCNVAKCSFVNCSSVGEGGGIYFYGQGNISDTSFENCHASYGGAIYFNNGGNGYNCSFTNCSADNDGGAVYWSGNDGKVENSTFMKCSANSGGSIYVSGGNNLDIIGSEFDDEDSIYGGTLSNCTFKEPEKTSPNVNVHVTDIEYGENQTVEVALPSDATGNITIELLSGDETVGNVTLAISNGFASSEFSNLAIGTYELHVRYPGNSRYLETVCVESFTVRPKVIISQNVSVASNANIYIDFGLNITDSIIVKIDGKTFAVADIDGGIVNYTFSTGKLSEGDHMVGFDYEGTLFDKEVLSGNYSMYLAPEEIPVPDEIVSDDDGVISLEFPINATGILTVYIDGEAQEIIDVGKELMEFLAQSNKTVEEIVVGILKIDLSKYKGNFTVTFVYSGDENYHAFEKQANATINVNTAIIDAKNANVLYSAGQTYTIKVYSDKNVLAKSGKVVVKANNKAFKTLTIKNGIASFKVAQVPGTYKLTITSLGKTVKKTLTVKHVVTLKTATVKRSAKSLVLTATLSKVNKKYLKNKKVTFKFNGKKYTAKTNAKGVAKVTVKSSVLKKLKVGKKVTYQATYLKDTVKKTVKVKK